MARVVGEAAIELARLADVVEHEHAAGDVSRAVADGSRGTFHIQLVAVAADQQHRPHGLDRTDAPDGDAQGILERLAGLLVKSAEDLLDRSAHRVLETPARQLLGNRIDVVDGRVGIRRDDPVADRLQRDLRALLLSEQRFFVELTLGDIELDAHQAQQPPVLVDARRGAADDPTPFAIAVTHPMGAFEDRRLTGDVVAYRRLHARQIVRMHQTAPVRRAAHILIRVAEHGLPARREVDLVAFHVEVPQAVIGGGLGKIGALLELGEARFDADALEARGQARADELHQQLHVHVPGPTRQGVCQAQKPRGLALDTQRNKERRPQLQLREALRLRRLLLAGRAGITQLGEAQMIEAPLEPG